MNGHERKCRFRLQRAGRSAWSRRESSEAEFGASNPRSVAGMNPEPCAARQKEPGSAWQDEPCGVTG